MVFSDTNVLYVAGALKAANIYILKKYGKNIQKANKHILNLLQNMVVL
jgi:hypothetical protein